jgi:hypothetical protein
VVVVVVVVVFVVVVVMMMVVQSLHSVICILYIFLQHAITYYS